MSTIKIAINGFGRIGRLSLRALLPNDQCQVVAINDLADNRTLAHLFKYDTAQGQFMGDVGFDEDHISVNGQSIKVFAERDPAQLPWNDLGVELVIECTGIFRNREGASKHLEAGAKKVVISAPAKGDIKTIVLGINDDLLTKEDDIISNASCTTNCLAPMLQVLHDRFEIQKGFVTTVHAYTADQRMQDAPHSDLRRARSAPNNIVPTSTGAAQAVGKVLPHLAGKLHGSALRVPVIDGSLTELTCLIKTAVDGEEINRTFKEAADNRLKGILAYTEEPLVSADIIGNPHSCIFDAGLTNTLDNMVKITGWYDNEFGYATRIADLTAKLCQLF